MRFRTIKIIIAVFVALICSFLAISAKYYVKTVQSFKTFYKDTEIKLISMENDCYQQLKKSLDDKYTKKFVEILNSTGKDFKLRITEVLGEEYILLREEFLTTINSIESKKKEFINSSEYVSAKNELLSIKLKVDNASDTEKDGYLEEFRSALNKMSTYNTKLNNQLKGERDRIDEIKASVKKLFIKNAKELISIRKELMNSTRIEISSLLSDYNVELKELNSTFNVELNDKAYPFDVTTMGDCLVAGKLESECFSEILYENSNKTVIYSENSSEIVS